MTTSCIVNNYNYCRFVIEAVESALAQTDPFDEIIVVDDGSTDESVGLLQWRYQLHPKVRVIAKANQGQLSCFNIGFAAASGDLVFFLDSDDLYEKEYVAKAKRYYQENACCDFLFCAMRKFGEQSGLLAPYPASRILGYSAFTARYLRKWIGAPTSAISMRRTALERILPLPESFYLDWKTRADDCLVYGASMTGCCKCYLGEALVGYRIHGENGYDGKSFSNYGYRLRMNMALGNLNNHFWACFTQTNACHLIGLEFDSIQRPALRDLIMYASAVRHIPASITSKLRLNFSLMGSYLKSR